MKVLPKLVTALVGLAATAATVNSTVKDIKKSGSVYFVTDAAIHKIDIPVNKPEITNITPKEVQN